MRSAGVDIASAGHSAIALAVNGALIRALVWQADNKKDSEPTKLVSFAHWLDRSIWLLKPDVVAVEQVAGFHNRQVIQNLSRFEGVALYIAKRRGCIVLNPMVSQARAAIGIPGNSKKEVAFTQIKEMFPEFDFGRANSGGMDRADAATHALAAPVLLERRK